MWFLIFLGMVLFVIAADLHRTAPHAAFAFFMLGFGCLSPWICYGVALVAVRWME